MFPATVEALSAVMFVGGIAGALIASGAWLSERKFLGRSSRQGRGRSSGQDERR